nr:tetratricopeptide repeat protein [Govania unica]
MGLWKKYGPGMIAALVLLVVAIGAYQFWQYRVEVGSARDSEAFGKAVALIEAGKQDEALKSLTEIQKDGSKGYSFLAGMREADILFARGDRDGAVKTYERLAADGGADKSLRQYAKLQVIALQIDNPKAGDLKGQLEELAAPGAAWAPMAEEFLALLEIRSGEVKAARERLDRLAANADVGQSMRNRAKELADTLPAPAPAPAPTASKPQ